MDAIDLRAERDRVIARRANQAAADRRRAQAFRILNGHWNASPEQLEAAIAERYTKMEPDERTRLLAVVLEVQRTERPHVDPDQIHARPPASERTDGKRLLAPVTCSVPKEDSQVAKTTAKPVDLRSITEGERSRLLSTLQAAVMEKPKLTPAEAQEIVREAFGWELNLIQAERYIEKAVRAWKAERRNGTKAAAVEAAPESGKPYVPLREAVPAVASGFNPGMLMGSFDPFNEGQAADPPAESAPGPESAAAPAANPEAAVPSAPTADADDDHVVEQLERGASTLLGGGGALREAAEAVSEIVEGERMLELVTAPGRVEDVAPGQAGRPVDGAEGEEALPGSLPSRREGEPSHLPAEGALMHRLPAALLSRPVRVLVVGCGGTGSAIASGLPYLHQAIVARGHSHGLAVTLMDGDTVSEANCVRQPFCRGEIGYPKATVLASRMNLFWGFQWSAIPRHLTPADALTRTADIVVGCVDTREARSVIARLATERNADVRYWLDLGNNAEDGQYVLGQPRNAANPDRPGRLPTAAELWPEIVDTKRKGENLPSCSASEALTRQAPFVNQVLANHALSMLARLFAGGITHHGGFVNLATGKASSIPVPPQPEPEKPVAKKVRARRGRRVPA